MWSGTETRPLETARRHADDRERLPVDDERFVEDVRVRVKPRAPIGLTQNDDEVSANRLVVVGGKQAAERWLHAK
jgi:hypothetical protein